GAFPDAASRLRTFPVTKPAPKITSVARMASRCSLVVLIHGSDQRAVQLLGEINGGGLILFGRVEKSPSAEQEHDRHARPGGVPQPLGPRGPEIVDWARRNQRHDALLERRRHAVIRRSRARNGYQFPFQFDQLHTLLIIIRRLVFSFSYRYFSLAIFANILRISARARNART